ncbi:procollagen C-endopeptidase enhancer 1-like [Strongylocentrotus purpuratus]|uniref:CUB domain-containing protein n=1 Tax=Strongylocentrotus purpuratus TaxID=7668 RepID=A0A7M7STX0_STRPU|nr:procollagen C-endopeptidase enhancer 1-like [Strongylocentrotus purpuratus]
MNCEYLVSTTDENKVMQLSFEVFDIESDRLCGQDSLTVYDGTSTSDPRLAILCRDTIPESLLSTGRSLFLVFKSDHYGSGQGFSASYQAVESGGGY